MSKRILIISVLLIILGSFQSRAQVDDTRANTPVPFTLADRDRLLSLENNVEMLNQRITSFEKRVDERFAAMQKNMDERFAAQDKRLDDLHTLMILLLGAMFTLFGFILWDRKTTVRPVQREQEKVIEALRALAKEDEKIANIFQKAGLL